MAGSFTAQGLGMEALSVVQIIEQARGGSLPHLVELNSRTQEHYAEHHSSILDCFLSQLRLPEGYDETDQGSRLDGVTTGISALSGLIEIFRCLSATRGLNPVKVSTSIRLSNDAAEYTSWIRALLLETFATDSIRTSPPLGVFHATVTFYDSLFKAFPRLLLLLSSQPLMLDVAIAWWTVLYNESPVVYPGRERSHNANEDGAGDAAMSIMHKLAKENPKAISKAIISGRMCDLQTFVERSLQRMWCMLRIKQISHLVDYPEATVENVNLRSLFLMTHTLMLTDPRIHDAFMKKQASSVYLTVLSSTTGRLYSRITSPGSTNISNRRDQIHHINEIVDLALLPVQWVASTSFRARKNMVEATKHAMGVLGDCIQILDEGEVIFESIFDQLKPYTPNRKVFPIMAAGLSTMGQRTATLPDSSARKVYVCTGLGFTWGWGEMLVDERQESLCDNMKHKDRVVVSEKTSDLPERSCSRCHSVVYCSVECQSEDWQTFHRAECSHMRKQYKDCKRRQRQYSYRDRKLHVNLLRYCFESNDVCLRTAAVNRGTPELYQATLARRNTQIVFKDNDIEPGPGDEAGVYLQKVLPSIPLHLHGRFAAIVSIFSQAVEKARVGERTRARGRGNNMKFINNGVGSIRLVEKFFRYGDEDINLVLLLEQAKTLPLFTGGTVMEADRAADEFTRRDVGETHFNIISSMAYTCARRKAKPMSWDGIEWQPPEERMVPLGY